MIAAALCAAALAVPAAAQDAGVIRKPEVEAAPDPQAEEIRLRNLAAQRAYEDQLRAYEAAQRAYEAERSAYEAARAAEAAELERGLPVCPGDPRCKKKP